MNYTEEGTITFGSLQVVRHIIRIRKSL
jgi:hypothetical protein